MDAGRGMTAGINPGMAVIWRLGSRSGFCGVPVAVGGGGGTDAGRGIVVVPVFPANPATGGGGGGTDPRRGPAASGSGAFTTGAIGGGGTDPRRGTVGGSGILSGATILSVVEGNGRRVGSAITGSLVALTVFTEITLRSSKTSIASSDTSIVGSSRMNAPRGIGGGGGTSFDCTAAATAPLLKIVVTASYAVSSSSSSPPFMRYRMYRSWKATGTDHFPRGILLCRCSALSSCPPRDVERTCIARIHTRATRVL